MKTIIGITGGIGSGKSTISKFFQTEGYPIYDCDSNSKNIANSSLIIKEKLITTFGKDIYDKNGLLNKELLAEKIFGNENNRQIVNSIIHPEVIKNVQSWITKETRKIIFIESALLFESGLNKIVDKTIFVDAKEEIRLQRAIIREIKNRGLNNDENNTIAKDILLRIQSQRQNYEYAKEHSDFIILNNNELLINQLLICLNNILQTK